MRPLHTLGQLPPQIEPMTTLAFMRTGTRWSSVVNQTRILPSFRKIPWNSMITTTEPFLAFPDSLHRFKPFDPHHPSCSFLVVMHRQGQGGPGDKRQHFPHVI